MDDDLPSIEKLLEFLVARAEMIDPDRSIRENRLDRVLRRGVLFKPGIDPPMDANRRALSRSISALRASRTKAVFSATPVNSWAIRTRSSSRARVVLIGIDYNIR
jgi:hypothetical protein